MPDDLLSFILPVFGLTSLSAGFVLIIIWLFKNLIITRLTNSVKHEYETKLSILQSSLQEQELRLTAQLKVKESQINLLLTGALSNINARQAEIAHKKLDSINRIWEAVNDLAALKLSSKLLSRINYSKAIELAKTDSTTRKFFVTFNSNKEHMEKKLEAVRCIPLCRPYISPILWSLYDAYVSVLSTSYIQMQLLSNGLEDFAAIDKVIELLKKALPHQSKFLDQHKAEGIHYLVDELEEAIFKEIVKALQDDKEDEKDIHRAAEIQKYITENFSQPLQ